MTKAELVFIPTPVIGHIVSTVELAKLIINRNNRLSITVLVMKLPHDSSITNYTKSIGGVSSRMRFVHLSSEDSDSLEQHHHLPPAIFLTLFIENKKSHVKKAVNDITRFPDSPRLAGFVVDMFATSMIDVANEFGVPTYVYLTSGAACLSTLFHLQSIKDDGHNIIASDFKDDKVIVVPGFVNPVPANVLPSVMVDEDLGSKALLTHAKRFRESKGILINTVLELEPHTFRTLQTLSSIPKVYPVGPILDLNGGGGSEQKQADILAWLDGQPPASVVFLCFGSLGSFRVDQLKQIANGLERSGHRFLWSLRGPSAGKFSFPTDYTNLEQVLPEGFLERTSNKGKVIGWAPQVAILSHRATGGFVSHCGWNSILESLWFGVPIAALPMYAEQQLNAYEMVNELRLAVEIKLDYKIETGVVGAGELETGIRYLMEQDGEVRNNAKEMKEISKKAVIDGGSSYICLGQWISDVIQNMP
nr:chalcone 2'-glucosyltransferase [Paeonia delavayi]